MTDRGLLSPACSYLCEAREGVGWFTNTFFFVLQCHRIVEQHKEPVYIFERALSSRSLYLRRVAQALLRLPPVYSMLYLRFQRSSTSWALQKNPDCLGFVAIFFVWGWSLHYWSFIENIQE